MSEKPYTPPDHGTFPSSTGQLVLVATPVGNLADISQRALDALRTADAILCEDTRVTTKLLRHYGISNQLFPLHDHNEQDRIPALIERLQQGECLALVSDAGTPIVSDPGYRLVRAAQAENIAITSLPGANAAVTALTLSGLPPIPFMFLGFPPRGEARRHSFTALRAAEQAGLAATLIWYESPHRLLETLKTQQQVFGSDRPAAVGRELTKHFEEMIRGSLAELIAHFEETAPRGEITLLLGPPAADDTGAQELDQALQDALKTHSVKDAAALIAGIVNLPKRTVYNRALELARQKKGG
ncbi:MULTISPECIES: 16S rRNA (cytidine(1402)-2'-O)-methyltransferase [Acetobacteraceae]|uniref:16S rRNA (cytidine(1402)-2'-O)-methyltransferase n=2 Tax=Acetobacterales TaxID=3120395 RepID=UPI00187B889D|nr:MULTISPECIES: 16S rRNA (cytidine(1402)-2'-O)-methyltransferase [Acetobacteraceae]MCT6819023.1 16S rRNA (cytidine(1402)-2'-O)-methyltransferase [Bombella apis]MCT6844952.1 16S rRNA (cytidine(1402)-2'-O)-methyltransferase [Bombella apis]